MFNIMLSRTHEHFWISFIVLEGKISLWGNATMRLSQTFILK
jgi:hypothetical protein